MRLSDFEIKSIVESITSLDSNAQVYLYGSRVDDNKKGGDIDLLAVSQSLKYSDKIDILISIKDKIGDQKIDLKIATEKELREDPFLNEIFPQAIVLNN